MTRDNRLDLEIMQLFLRNTYLRLSINEIAKRLGKQYPNINRKCNELLTEGILKKQVIGRSHLCSLNLNNPKTRLLMGLIELRKLEAEQPKKVQALRDSLANIRKDRAVQFALLQGKELFVCTPEQNLQSLASEHSWQVRSVPTHEMSRILLEKSLFSDHLLLYGYDRYYEFLSDHDAELRPALDPLVNPKRREP